MQRATADSRSNEIRENVLSSIVGNRFSLLILFVSIIPFVPIVFWISNSVEREEQAEHKARMIQNELNVLKVVGPGAYGPSDPLQPSTTPEDGQNRTHRWERIPAVYIDFDLNELPPVDSLNEADEPNPGCENSLDRERPLICV